MKLLYLGDINSSHTLKWITSLSKYIDEICIFSFKPLEINSYKDIKNIKIETLDIKNNQKIINKINYLKGISKLKKIIKNFKPDILHAHYATSYGLLGALSGFHPFILSVWGSDVFDFPKKSFFHKYILKYNLKKADKIVSTSNFMAKETQLYTDKYIEVIPFGIDLEQFKPMNIKNQFFNENDIVIGTVKALEKIYGIEYLIKAFKILSDKYKQLPLKLLIVGGGSLENKLKNLTSALNIEDKTIFVGKVPFLEVPKYHNMLSISVFMSLQESFGVSVIESMACEKPVIVSDAGGLREIVENGVTGFVVPSKRYDLAAKAMENMILNKSIREELGKNGRKRVKKLYNWEDNVKQIIKIYKDILK